jgi:hypothetical protein
MEPYKNEARALTGAQESVKGLVVGNDVYDPLIFQPEIVRFSKKQYVFLHAYRVGVPLPEAAAKAQLTPEQAIRFLEKEGTIAWLKDRALQDHIKTEWEEPAKWWKLGADVLDGSRELSKAQQEVFKEFGRRIAPVAADFRGPAKIEINIDPAAVQKAFERQSSIEAQIVGEQG